MNNFLSIGHFYNWRFFGGEKSKHGEVRLFSTVYYTIGVVLSALLYVMFQQQRYIIEKLCVDTHISFLRATFVSFRKGVSV